MKNCGNVEQEMSRWTAVSVHSHRFAGLKFRRGAEIGHIHPDGIVPTHFPRSTGNALLFARPCRGTPLATQPRLDHVSNAHRTKFRACFVVHKALIRALQTQNRDRAAHLLGTGK